MISAKSVLLKEYGHSRNFVTPEILHYGWICDEQVAYELSKGEGILDSNEIYGVTIVRYENKETERDNNSRCFSGPTAKEDAKRYIRKLKNEWGIE